MNKMTIVAVAAALMALAPAVRAESPEALRLGIVSISDGRTVLKSPQAVYVRTDTISERTAAAGVTVDGLLIKDGVARSPAQGPDTNATTALSAYTSRYIGDLLLGKSGTTNWMWAASAASVTNAWGIGWPR